MIILRVFFPFITLLGVTGAAWAQPHVFFERYQAGRTQIEQGQFDAAVASFNSALAAVSAEQVPDPNIYVALGYAQLRLGRLGDAEASFNIAQREVGRLTPASREQLQGNVQVLRQLRGR